MRIGRRATVPPASAQSLKASADSLGQILILFAVGAADRLDQRKVGLGLVHLSQLDEQDALIFERARMLGVELEGPRIGGAGRFRVAGIAIGKAEQIVGIGALGTGL